MMLLLEQQCCPACVLVCMNLCPLHNRVPVAGMGKHGLGMLCRKNKVCYRNIDISTPTTCACQEAFIYCRARHVRLRWAAASDP